jgi:hypothetical protein
MSTLRPKTEVYLFGSLLNGSADLRDCPIPLDLEAPTPICEVLNLLTIPVGKVQVVMVNHKAVCWDHMIYPGDRVSLFPREYPFFADWKDFRFSFNVPQQKIQV